MTMSKISISKATISSKLFLIFSKPSPPVAAFYGPDIYTMDYTMDSFISKTLWQFFAIKIQPKDLL